jgi:hypothetical protein
LAGEKELLLRGSGEVVIVTAATGAVRGRYSNVIAADAQAGLIVIDAENGVRVIRARDGEVLAESRHRALEAAIAADGSRVGLVVWEGRKAVSLPLKLDRAKLQRRAEALTANAATTAGIR